MVQAASELRQFTMTHAFEPNQEEGRRVIARIVSGSQCPRPRRQAFQCVGNFRQPFQTHQNPFSVERIVAFSLAGLTRCRAIKPSFGVERSLAERGPKNCTWGCAKRVSPNPLGGK